MSKLLFTVRAIVRHAPYTLAHDQTDPILEEVNYQLTAKTKEEVHDHILDDANKMGVIIQELFIEGKRELREPEKP